MSKELMVERQSEYSKCLLYIVIYVYVCVYVCVYLYPCVQVTSSYQMQGAGDRFKVEFHQPSLMLLQIPTNYVIGTWLMVMHFIQMCNSSLILVVHLEGVTRKGGSPFISQILVTNYNDFTHYFLAL